MSGTDRPERRLSTLRSDSWVLGTAKGASRFIASVFYDLKAYGAGHIPNRGGALMVSNHQSFLDPVMVGVLSRRPVGYMARSTLFSRPLFGRFLLNLRAFPVRRGEGDIGAVRETIRRLREGHIINIFPEGTRSGDGELQPMQSGLSLIVKRAGVPVIPVAVDGSFAAWPRGRKWPGLGTVRVIYGPALKVEGLRAAEIVPLIHRTIGGLLGELRGRELK